MTASRRAPAPSLAVAIVLGVVLLALLMLALSGPGYRHELWSLGTAFTMLRRGAYLAIAGAVLALVAMVAVRPRGRHTALLGLAFLVAAIPVATLWRMRQAARGTPPIHDVSTDLADPPAFVAVLPLRAGAPNPAAHGGDSVAMLQRAGYPDIIPVELPVPPAAAFAQARRAAEAMGWTMVAADSAAGRIEATATTRWFHFQDDVVIRVRPDARGSRVDVRSVSRLGGGDAGANAARVRAYVRRLRDVSAPT